MPTDITVAVTATVGLPVKAENKYENLKKSFSPFIGAQLKLVFCDPLLLEIFVSVLGPT